MITLCTLFDSYYLDKGLALYQSLEQVCDNFMLYIFCFDDKSFNILKSMNLKHANLIHHSKIEDEILLNLKGKRSKAEYCWTCTPVIIEYVLDNYNVDNCTYIDADLYFFSDPQILFDEIKCSGANTAIMAHRFTESRNDRRLCRRSGKYCVEFNYFDKTENSREALTWWKERCFEWCYHLYEPDRMGDQKYLEKFPVLFKGVHEVEHLGGGMAPWNLKQYTYVCDKDKMLIFKENKTGKQFPLIFYHFQNLRYLNENWINICSGTRSIITKNHVYKPYLKAIEQIREYLKTYGVEFGLKNIHSSNKFISLLQGTILRFKVQSLSDVYGLKQFRGK